MNDPLLPAARGMTVREVGRYLRIRPDRVREMIQRGELGAVDVSDSRSGRSRLIILPGHLREYEERHQAVEPPRISRRRSKSHATDFYPD
jgi:excisionase family DNA binding protein